MLALIAPAACKLEKIGDLTFFQQQDAIVSMKVYIVGFFLHTCCVLLYTCTLHDAGQEKNKEIPKRSSSSAEGQRREEAGCFRESHQRGKGLI